MDKTNNATELDRRWAASELRKLPSEQRDAIMEAAAALAEEDYRNDTELTSFLASSAPLTPIGMDPDS